jgi:aspartate racemase
MKTIGLLGGMSWESSAQYYRLINEAVKRRLGGLHSARSLMLSVDFAEIEALQQTGGWTQAAQMLGTGARQLEEGGADFVVLCTNTMHRVADEVAAATSIPLLHIADPTAAAIAQTGLRRVGLLATRYTMEQDFYRGRLKRRHGLEVVIPDEPLRTTVHTIIYDELCLGDVREASRELYRDAIESLIDVGAEGVILGCTEITLLIGQEHSRVPLFDTTQLHAHAAVDAALYDAGCGVSRHL